MSLDVKYRPKHFDDVLGQTATVKILREFVKTGTGFHQSYLFAGAHGGGKTTLGRILARALLCELPRGGNPCDQCGSCISILETGGSENFIEVDAATNSGKEDIKKILEVLAYSTFSGKRRLYLFDESHQLSKGALDALLKPMEDNVAGSDEKRLVCIFCTTEPEKMRATIISRCAPVFVIRPVSPSKIADRLADICTKEGIDHELDMLVQVAEMTECHIRDALKTVEGIAMLGGVTRENTVSFLHLDLNDTYLEILAGLGVDVGIVNCSIQKILQQVSPTTCYAKLSELAVLVYQVHLGVGKPSLYWDLDKIKLIGQKHGDFLIDVAKLLSDRPGRPTPSMLLCDVLSLHRFATREISGSQNRSSLVFSSRIENHSLEVSPPQGQNSRRNLHSENINVTTGAVPRDEDGCTSLGVYTPNKAISKDRLVALARDSRQGEPDKPQGFAQILNARFEELREGKELSTGAFAELLRARVFELDSG